MELGCVWESLKRCLVISGVIVLVANTLSRYIYIYINIFWSFLSLEKLLHLKY